MSSITFVTDLQKEHLERALSLTGSEGFAADARAIAAYSTTEDGQPGDLISITVFENFRGGRAEVHFGNVLGRRMTREIFTTMSFLAFHPKYFNISRLMARCEPTNVNMLCTMLKMGFQFEYRDRYSMPYGEDGIVLSLEREDVLAAAGPQQADRVDAALAKE